MDHDAFLTNDLVIDGVARNLEIIGEAVGQLPEEFRRNHPKSSGRKSQDCGTELFTITLVWILKSSGKSSSTICTN
jgi:hypothetical protein